MLKELLERFPDIDFVIIDGFDAATKGIIETSDGLHIMYSLGAIYEILINEHGCESKTDCDEWYYHNMLPLSDIESGPMFLEDLYDY